jgi:hypothetical protein
VVKGLGAGAGCAGDFCGVGPGLFVVSCEGGRGPSGVCTDVAGRSGRSSSSQTGSFFTPAAFLTAPLIVTPVLQRVPSLLTYGLHASKKKNLRTLLIHINLK